MSGNKHISEIGLVFTTIFSEICFHYYLQNKLPVHTKVVLIEVSGKKIYPILHLSLL